MKVIILLGPPGSGKGTQARLLSEALHAPLIGMGDLLRHEIQQKTEIGREIQEVVNAGNMPPWATVRNIFKTHLDKITDPLVIFDGVPRNQTQVVDVERMLASRHASILQAFFLDVSEQVLIHRIMNRYQCAKCGAPLVHQDSLEHKTCETCGSIQFKKRTDDQEEVIKRRLDVFHETSDPLVAHYKSQGILTIIDGTLPVLTVRDVILKRINELLSSQNETCSYHP